jgi:hypothetical protein
MNIVEAWIERTARNSMSQIAIIVIFSVLFWALGMPTFLNKAHAAYMSQISDELGNSAPAAMATHLINFTTSTSTFAGQTFSVILDPNGGQFTEYQSLATTTDITVSGFTQVATSGACPGSGDNAYPAPLNYNTGTNEGIVWTVCPGNTIPAGHVSIGIGSTSTKLWQNPPSTGSYIIDITGTSLANGETRIAIVNNVTLTASVNTSFTFTVTGLATSTAVNGETSTGSSTATNLAFGTLVPGAPSSVAQKLNVTTNASNGFFVTVQENQPPTSGTGNIIYLFKDGATTTSPIVWTTPRGIINQNQTYGHFGISSDDSDEGGTYGIANSGEFHATSTTPYVGNIIFPRLVFSNNGPADGLTQDVGKADVIYKIEISALQAAGNDYTNTLTYVATPIF